ncbi:MAG: hypothetical protein JWM19_2252 [Actinomycetia bacterium]|nr:hypothetical protein [Actinomycetes bacterium]
MNAKNRPKTMKVYVVIPNNDREKVVNRIRVRTSLEPLYGSMVGKSRDCGVIDADLSLKAARVIAKWYESNK